MWVGYNTMCFHLRDGRFYIDTHERIVIFDIISKVKTPKILIPCYKFIHIHTPIRLRLPNGAGLHTHHKPSQRGWYGSTRLILEVLNHLSYGNLKSYGGLNRQHLVPLFIWSANEHDVH